MIKLLISVKNVEEALQAQTAGVDFIDLKNPEDGALGDLGFEVTSDVLAILSNHTIVSATIGDRHESAEEIIKLVEQKAMQGVNIVKMPISSYLDSNYLAHRLNSIHERFQTRFIGVFNANDPINYAWIDRLTEIGFYGAMLDTFNKQESLLKAKSLSNLQLFVNKCKERGLFVGLAGTLEPNMLADLTHFEPNFLGFRSGVCEKNMRKNKLVPSLIVNLKKKLYKCNSYTST